MAFGLLTGGRSLGKVARELGVPRVPSASSGPGGGRFRLGEDKAVMGDLVKSGRKKLFSPEQNRWLKEKVRENPLLSPAQLK